MKYFFSIVILFGCIFFIQCSSNDIAGGTSTSENTIVAGIVKDQDDNLVGDAVVSLYTRTYNPHISSDSSTVQTAITNKEGIYRFENLNGGTYNIVVKNELEKSADIIQSFEVIEKVQTNTPVAVLQKESTVGIPLQGLGAVEGDYFYIPGTGVYAAVTNTQIQTGVINLEHIPSASYASIIFAKAGDSTGINLLQKEIVLSPADTTVVNSFVSWGLVKKIYINTSTTGAALSGNVYDFPLLVRLNTTVSEATVLFQNAQSDGSDIRFAKQDFTPLHYEIERWDPVSKRAEIWVSIDTVFGNTDNQFIYLFTGNELAYPQSNSSTVFDTAHGFAGVWHLAEAANNKDNGYRDATVNGNHGTGVQMTDYFESGGYIDKAQFFNGSSSYIQVPHHNTLNVGTGDFTISVMVKADSIPFSKQIVCKHALDSVDLENGNYELQVNQDSLLMGNLTKTPDNLFVKSSTVLLPHQWYQVVLKREKSIVYLYLNGLQVGLTENVNVNVDSDGDFIIGNDLSAPHEYFHGIIDEVRIAKVARTPEWVQLNFQIQKSGSKVVTIQ
ncbi:MAG: DUF2341 domain-containing protein [Fibrobacteria bacterium]|nr:DUF2341 domain-containing protein [Fibrobacteria bacterium]